LPDTGAETLLAALFALLLLSAGGSAVLFSRSPD
jgi:LPXTG-motif cell wall-anchored protein